MFDKIEYTYKLTIYNDLKIPKRNLFVQELIDGKLDSTRSVEEICQKWRWQYYSQNSQESFVRCKEWLKTNHPELLL